MKTLKLIGKIAYNIVVVCAVFVAVWFMVSVVEIGNHNTDLDYTYNKYNLMLLLWSVME